MTSAPELRHVGRREIRRAVTIAAVILSSTASALVRHRSDPWRYRMAAGFARALERLGPTFVKVGQLITSSPGIFPRVLVDACSRHLYGVEPVSATKIRAAIEEDLGASIGECFDGFVDAPLAAASVAQVHACTLPDGTEAVVKVQRPDIAPKMVQDLRVLHRLARLANRIPRAASANLPGVVEDLFNVTMRELDFQHEADIQRRFGASLHAFGDNEMVTAPQIMAPLCGERTITMTRLRGTPLDQYAADQDRVGDGELVLRRAMKAWLEATLVHGPFHGDVHGGNIWVLDDGRVAFLDFGISGELDDSWRDLLKGLFYGTALDGGFARFARCAKDVGAIPEDAGSDEEIGERLAMLVSPFLTAGTAEISLAEVLRAAVATFEQFGAVIPTELVLVVKQLLYFEGYAKALAPESVLPADVYLLRNIFPSEVAARTAELGLKLPA